MLAAKKKRTKIVKDNEPLKIYIILLIFGFTLLAFGILNIIGLTERFLSCHWCCFISGVISIVVGFLLIFISFFCRFSKKKILMREEEDER